MIVNLIFKFKFATMAEPYFESIGINYVGIIDGHDIKALTEIFEKIKKDSTKAKMK